MRLKRSLVYVEIELTESGNLILEVIDVIEIELYWV